MNAAAWESFNWQRPRWNALATWAETPGTLNAAGAKSLAPLLDHWRTSVTLAKVLIGLDPVDEELLPTLHQELQTALRNSRDFMFTAYAGDEATPEPSREDLVPLGRESEWLYEQAHGAQQYLREGPTALEWIVGGALAVGALWGVARVLRPPTMFVVMEGRKRE